MTSVKFGYSAMAEALYEIASDAADESLGHTDYGFCALFLCYGEWTINATEWSGDDDIVIPAGSFITLHEATSGAVGTVTYATDTEAQEAFDTFAYHFAIWEEANGY